jgi:hypothetical protein
MQQIACDSSGFDNQLQKCMVLQTAGVTVTHVSLNELSAVHAKPVSYPLNYSDSYTHI